MTGDFFVLQVQHHYVMYILYFCNKCYVPVSSIFCVIHITYMHFSQFVNQVIAHIFIKFLFVNFCADCVTFTNPSFGKVDLNSSSVNSIIFCPLLFLFLPQFARLLLHALSNAWKTAFELAP